MLMQMILQSRLFTCRLWAGEGLKQSGLWAGEGLKQSVWISETSGKGRIAPTQVGP